MSADEYTPTIEQVQIMFVGRHEEFYGPLEKKRRAQFDRFLAAHDAEVAAKALEEAARAIVRTTDGDSTEKFILVSADREITVVSQWQWNRGIRGPRLVDWLLNRAAEYRKVATDE